MLCCMFLEKISRKCQNDQNHAYQATSVMCKGCPFVVNERCYKENLICLPLLDLDVILGMDWLPSNQILLDYARKPLIFPDPKDSRFIIAIQVEAAIDERAQGYMVLSFLEVKSCSNMNYVAIVKDFLEVFPGPILVAPYKMALAELAELKQKVDKLLEKKMIRPSVSLRGASMMLVKKDDGSRYHHIKVKVEDVQKTMIKMRYGHYEYVVMPFGVTNAPTIFNPSLDKFVVVFIEDKLVYSFTREEHEEHLRAVLEVLKKKELSDKSGCCVAMGTSEDCNGEQEFHWVGRELIRRLTTSSVVILPNPNISFKIYCNASHQGLGCMLMQERKVVTYSSRQLKLHEKNYPTYDLELATIVFALMVLRHYLYGAKFMVFNDNKSLDYLFDQKELNMRQRRTKPSSPQLGESSQPRPTPSRPSQALQPSSPL
ncbi:hypothetical protein CR513_49036, partial [Mucuna pruriens]